MGRTSLRNWSNNCPQSTSLSSRSILGIKTSNMYWDWFPSHRQKDEEAQNSEMRKSSYLCLFVAVYCVFRQHLTIMCVFTQAVATLGPHRGRSDSESSAFPFRPDRSRPILNCWDTHTNSRIGKKHLKDLQHGNLYMTHGGIQVCSHKNAHNRTFLSLHRILCTSQLTVIPPVCEMIGQAASPANHHDFNR